MQDDVMSQWVKDAIAHGGVTQAKLAGELTGALGRSIDKFAVSKMTLGKRAVAADEMVQIAQITGYPVPIEQRHGAEDRRMSVVTIMGRIGAGAQIDVGVEQVPEGGEEIETVLPLPAGVIGFEVVGDSMYPRYDPGDVIVCDANGTPVDQLPEGEEAAVRTVEGLRYLKRVLRSEPRGFFNLESHNAAPIRGVQLEWAADVLAVIRASKWRRISDTDRRRLARKVMTGR